MIELTIAINQVMLVSSSAVIGLKIYPLFFLHGTGAHSVRKPKNIKLTELEPGDIIWVDMSPARWYGAPGRATVNGVTQVRDNMFLRLMCYAHR